MATVDQSYSESSGKMISNETMPEMSANMSGMHGMSGMLGISSNEKMSIFLEWMFIITAGLIGIPFAWVIISERRKNSR
ncbi:MAG: hypothetical protein WAN47_02550 [Nitrosotalea sp.]